MLGIEHYFFISYSSTVCPGDGDASDEILDKLINPDGVSHNGDGELSQTPIVFPPDMGASLVKEGSFAFTNRSGQEIVLKIECERVRN